jgi:spore maturation protein SpmB
MIALELLKESGVLEKISRRLEKYTRLIELPGDTAPILSVGILIGVILGSGMIIQASQESKYTKYQLNILILFIGICHAIIEETIIFTGLGGNGFVVLINRFFWAFFFVNLYRYLAKLFDKKIVDRAKATI